MRIAVNARFLLNDYREGYGNFLYETMKRITTNHPEHTFIFIFDRPSDKQFIFSSNIQPVVLAPAARHPVLFKWWFDYRIPGVLRKYKADVFVSTDGFCSLNTRIPQCLVIHDLAFLHYPHFIKRSHLFFYKRYTPRFLKKAEAIATVSEFSKRDIIENYKIADDRIDIIHNGVKELFRELTPEERIRTLERYSGGKEYFLYTGSIHPRKNLTNLLKAFSVFKKRQQSSMKLIIAGRAAWHAEPFFESLKSYRYRDDIIVTGYETEVNIGLLMGAAYAFVYPSLFEGFGIPVVEAMRCGVPVITSSSSAMEEIADGAALLADPTDYRDIAEKMMMVYKDEQLRKDLITKGKEVSARYSWETAATQLWNLILKASERGKG